MILPHDANESSARRMDPEDPVSSDVTPTDQDGLQGMPSDPSEPSAGWAPFDPGDTPELQDPGNGAGRVVAVVAAAPLVGAGWALSATIELARAWSDARPGAVLVDTDFSRPRMHHAVGVDNAVGLAEVLRGDAPASQATRVIEHDRLFCVPAGNTPGDVREAFDADRWKRLCRAFARAGVTVIAYVPANAPWAGPVLAQATDVVELREEDGALGLVIPDGVPLLAVLGPMPLGRRPLDPTGKEPVASVPLLAFELSEEEDPVYPTDERASAPSLRMLDPTPSPAPTARLTSQDRAGRDRRRRRLLMTMAVTAGVLAVAVGLRGLTATTAAPDAEIDAATVVPQDAEPIPPELRFSLGVGSYTDRTRAESALVELAAAVPEVSWYLSPVEIDGTVYHRVLGGLAPDSASAEALASRLDQNPDVGQDGWIIRDTRMVIDLGEAPDRAQAEAESDRLRALGVPAYVARVAYSDDTFRYRIYAGGYADTDETSHLLAMSASLGLDAAASPRMGSPAP